MDDKAKLNTSTQSWGTKYLFWCRGCGCHHSYDVRNDGNRPSWTFNGDLERPTFAPSLFYPDRVCHLFLVNGEIQYLGDCTHHLAGQTVPLLSFTEAPDEVVRSNR
jgi:hypothetical protein